MARFVFQIVDEVGVLESQVRDLPDEVTAVEGAIEIAERLLCTQGLDNAGDWDNWVLVVRHGDKAIAKIPLRESSAPATLH